MLSLATLVLAAATTARAVDNGLAITPQMGWNSWNRLGCNINSSAIIENAKAVKNLGLLELGYNIISIDDCWQAPARANGTNAPVADPGKFPDGMKSLVDQVKALGFKVGIYSDAGKYTCGGKFGSLGYETIDAQTYAEWGIEYLKYDNCFNEGQSGTPQISYNRYKQMGDALNATGERIFYSMCSWGDDAVWNWASTLANSWRMSGDIYDNFDRPDDRCPCTNSHEPCLLAGYHCSVMNVLEKAAGIGQKGRTGSWPDLDGLEVGNGEMTNDEYKVQFSLWSLLKSPLLLGNDVTNVDNETLAIITNKDVIAVNQDPTGSCGVRMWKKTEDDGTSTQLWKGNIANGTAYAMVVLNATPKDQTVNVSMYDFFIDEGKAAAKKSYQLYDLWANATLFKTVQENFQVDVPTHGVRMFRVEAAQSSS